MLALNQPRPTTRLTQFFQTNFEFVNEIIPRFGGFGLAMI